MAYTLGQFNQPKIDDEITTSVNNNLYMTPIIEGTALRRNNKSDKGVTGETSSDIFSDECVQLSTLLEHGVNYYFHAKIKRLETDQEYSIYLANYADVDSADAKTQFLKAITVKKGPTSEWVDLELMFTPLPKVSTFDCILFQLRRTDDYERGIIRYPTIVYEELSVVNDIINKKIKDNANLIKIGVQSKPGTMLCINGEEIHVGKTGVYEIRNGIITVNFFSVVHAAQDESIVVDGETMSFTRYLQYLATLSPNKENISSKCVFNNPKIRSIDSFVLDYMYK